MAGEYIDGDVPRLRNPELVSELRDMAKLVSWCYIFSKKNFDAFVSETGLDPSDVLIYEAKAAVPLFLSLFRS